MRVYKFLSVDAALDDIRKRHIKISEFHDINDALELLTIQPANPIDRPSLRRAIAEFAGRFGAICFSRNWTNPMLWALYADKHRGICLAFDVPAKCFGKIRYVTTPITVRRRNDLTLNLARRWIFSKCTSWKWEDEARVYATLDERSGKYYFADFRSSLKLRKIILGCRFQLRDWQRLERVLRRRRKPPTVVSTRISATCFEIEEEPAAFATIRTKRR